MSRLHKRPLPAPLAPPLAQIQYVCLLIMTAEKKRVREKGKERQRVNGAKAKNDEAKILHKKTKTEVKDVTSAIITRVALLGKQRLLRCRLAVCPLCAFH